MKNIITICCLMSLSLAHADAYNMNVNQRNALDTGNIARLLVQPTDGSDVLWAYFGATQLPGYLKLGTNLSITSGVLNASSGSAQVNGDWNAALPSIAAIKNKPTISTVAMTGNYGDLIDVPLTFASTWATVSGKPSFSTVATSGAYSDLSGAPSIPAAQVNSDWGAVSGAAQILNKPVNVSALNNDSGYLTSISGSQVNAALGFTPYSNANPSAYISQSGARTSISLTTTGASGAATYNNSTGVLNVPNYAAGTGTVTSITAGTGLSGGVITTSGTIALINIGTAGTYSGVTTDAQGRVTAGTNASQSAATRSLNTAFQISATRNAQVTYSVRITTTASIGGNQDGDVIFEIASDSGFTTNVQTVSITQNAQSISLAVVLNSIQTQTGVLTGFVPSGYYARLRTVNNTGTPSFLIRAAQEVLL